MKKRILIFSFAYYPRFVGGAEVAIKELTDRIGDEYEFDMVTLRKHAPSFEHVGNVKVYRVGWRWSGKRTSSARFFPLAKILFPILAYHKARALHRERHYDTAWSMMAAYAGFGALFFKLRHPNVPFILTLQEGDPISHIKRRALPVYPLFRMIFTRADIIQAISHYLADFGRSMGFNGPLEVVPNGVDTKRFINAPAAEVGKKEGETWLIHTGRLVQKNGIDTIIKSLTFMKSNVHALLLGNGRDKSVLESLTRKYHLQNRVHFLPYVHIEQVPSYLHACDIFVRPSRSEGMGNSFVEAMAAGLPVIATQEGGIADFLFDAKKNPDKPTTGWAVDKDSPEQIAQAVNDILGNHEQVKRVIQNARELVIAKYDWDLIARHMREKVFARVL